MAVERRLFATMVSMAFFCVALPVRSAPVANEAVPTANGAENEGILLDDAFADNDLIGERKDDGLEFDHTLGEGLKIDPFGATPHDVVAEMIEFAQIGKDDIVYDLGSGDGRIPIAAARDRGARGVGIELLPDLVQKSRKSAEEAGVAERVRFLKQDFFKTDFSEATAILLYLYPRTTIRLRPIFLRQMKPGTRIVAYIYGIEGWPRDEERPVKRGYGEMLYKWIVPANVSGTWKGALTLGPKDERPFELRLEQTFQQVKGVIRMEDKDIPLRDVALKADAFSFSFTPPGAAPLALTGKATDDTLRGAIRTADEEAAERGTWQAERKPDTKTEIDPGIPETLIKKPAPADD